MLIVSVCISGHSATCDFESGYCTWSNDFPSELIWLLHSGETPSFDTGPLKDHTLGTAAGKEWGECDLSNEDLRAC